MAVKKTELEDVDDEDEIEGGKTYETFPVPGSSLITL
jgi:hypothetical protein